MVTLSLLGQQNPQKMEGSPAPGVQAGVSTNLPPWYLEDVAGSWPDIQDHHNPAPLTPTQSTGPCPAPHPLVQASLTPPSPWQPSSTRLLLHSTQLVGHALLCSL